MIEEVKEAIQSNDIDQVITCAKHIEKEDLEEATQIYEKYYAKEMDIAKTTQDIVAQIKIRRLKNKIPNIGNYSYTLED